MNNNRFLSLFLNHYRKNREIFNSAIVLAIFFLFYLPFMPETVQMFDTGELVTNSHLLRVVHPPGYPLFTWVYYIFTNILPFENIFWLSSLLTVFLCLGTLLIIFKSVFDFPVFFRFLFAGVVATTSLFWRYALLPDVFMMHLLFIATILYLYIKEESVFQKVDNNLLILFIWGVSTAHHNTTIFLLPIIIHAFVRKKEKTKYFYSLLGISLSLALYCSILFLDTSSITSWGNINDIPSLVRHILRSDYGTFQLTVGNEVFSPTTNLLEKSRFFLNSSIISLFPILFIILLGLGLDSKSILKDKKSLLLILIFTLYVLIFFTISNIPLSSHGKEVFSRFMLMPSVILIFLAARFLLKSLLFQNKKFRYLLFVLMILSITLNYITSSDLNNFSKNTVMEDWAYNKIDPINSGSDNIVILVTGDSKLFSLYYVQNILRFKPYVPVISPRLIFHEWYFDKVVAKLDKIKLNKERIVTLKRYNIYNDFLLPNLEQYSFFVDEYNIKQHPGIRFQYTPMGTIFNNNNNNNNNNSEYTYFNLSRNNAKIISSPENILFPVEKEVLYEPCRFFLKNISENPINKKPINSLRFALRYTPFCHQAALKLCQLGYDKNRTCLLASKTIRFKNYILERNLYD